MIFFITFVLLFTICIYSSMLVSVFCSYVWGKREQQIQKDIVANLRIQCHSCDHKYKYPPPHVGTLIGPKSSLGPRSIYRSFCILTGATPRSASSTNA